MAAQKGEPQGMRYYNTIGMKSPGKAVVGYGWTGTYSGSSDHRLGWLMPEFIAHNQRESLTVAQRMALGMIPNRQYADGDMWRVKITIEPVKDRRGRYIVKRYRKSKTVRSAERREASR